MSDLRRFQEYARAMGVQGDYGVDQWQQAYKGDLAYQQVRAQSAADAMRAAEQARLGLPQGGQMPSASRSILPPRFSDPVTGAFRIPDQTRAGLRRMGLDPETLESTVNRNLLERTGADYQTRLLYGQQAGQSPDKVVQAKEELFAKAARALAAAPDEEAKQRIMRATFTGPNANQLLAEFNQRMAKEVNKPGPWDDILRAGQKAASVPTTAFGNIMAGLGGLGDVARSAIGAATGARHEGAREGQPVTWSDVGREATNLPKDAMNVLLMGLPGLIDPRGRSTTGAPGIGQIASSMRTQGRGDDIAQLLVPFLGPTKWLQEHEGSGWGGRVTAFLGDIATDPTSYVTLGYGGLGSAATRAAGNVAQRASLLKRLGIGDDIIRRFASADEASWATLLTDVEQEVGPKAFRMAMDESKAFRIAAENAHGSAGWRGYAGALADEGLDADQLLPRGFIQFGRQGKLATQLAQARGGVSLRGGFGIGGLQVRGFANLKGGTGNAGLRPVGTWFMQEGNRPHQLVSQTLDSVADVFHYGGGGDREFVHNNRGLFNATMTATTIGRGVGHQFDDLGRHAQRHGERLKSFLRADPRNGERIIDVIEKGDRSDYVGLVPAQVREAAEGLAAQLDAARTLAEENGVPIPVLREILDNDAVVSRYFPHKVRDGIRQRTFSVIPAKVGAQRARALRSGSNVTLGGQSETIREGSFAEIQDITRRILGEELYESDPVAAVTGYIHSVGNAAALNRTYRQLTDAGLLVPDVSDIAPGSLRGPGDPVRAIWAQPMERAVRAHTEAQAAVGKVAEDVRLAMRDRAQGFAREAEIQAQLAMYASRHADADSKIHALKLKRSEIEEYQAIARRDYRQAVKDAKVNFQEARRNITAELRKTRGTRRDTHKLIGELTRQHVKTLEELERGYKAQVDVLAAKPEALRAELLRQINDLGREAVGGRRPFNVVRRELAATRHRLAQVEGGELAAGRRSQLYERAIKGALGKREVPLARQRKASQEAEGLNEQIGELNRAVQAAEKAGDEAREGRLRTELTALMSRRAEALAQAEAATQEAAGLYDIVDMAEAAMRVAELRTAEVAAHEAGATIDGQVGRLSPRVQQPLARLLQVHAADLVAEAQDILAVAPKLKFLDRAMREYSRIDTSVAAIPPKGAGRALSDFAEQYMRQVEGRSDDILKTWEAAVGDQTKAYVAARDEYRRQMSALLAREDELQREYAAMRGVDPRQAALAAHQREGDQLNFFQAELDRHTQQLEWWQDNRDEIRKTQTLMSVSLREAVKGNAELEQSLGALQRLQETDAEAAALAAERLFKEPRVFELMMPQVEHLGIVVGKLPFMEGGAAMPQEVARVVERVMTRGQEGHGNFVRVLEMFNRRWKRAVLFSPGSVFRRWFGNTYNAVVLAGVSPSSFGKAMDAIGFAREAKTLDKIRSPELRRYMELAMEQNIFEGQLASLATDTAPFQGGLRHPVQRAEEILQIAALRGEDVARLAQFIDGLDAGMGPEASRLWTGKYHFFNNELTPTERNALRPLYPFYAYLRNNFALQYYTLFHQPGKIAAYGYMMRDMSSQPEGSTSPEWVEQSGGFPIGGSTWLQNTMVDTSPLGAAQTIAGVASRGQGSGWSPSDLAHGELVSSASPLLTTGISALTGMDPQTGEKMYPQDIGEGAGPILPALRALGMVNDAGKWNPRALAAYRALFPVGSRVGGIMGGLTPAQGEQGALNNIGLFLGPNARTQGPRQERGAYLQRGRTVQDILAGMQAQGTQVPTTADLTSEERTKRAIQMLLGG